MKEIIKIIGATRDTELMLSIIDKSHTKSTYKEGGKNKLINTPIMQGVI